VGGGRRQGLAAAALHAVTLSGRALQSLLPRGHRPGWREGTVPGGTLRLVGGIPLLRLSGSRYRMGLAHGLLLRDQVRTMKEAYLESFYGGPAKRPMFAARARVLEPHIPRGFREEMHGLRVGAGLSAEDVLLVHTFLDVHKLLLCSTLTAPRPEAAGGPVVGRNLDFPGLGFAHRFGIVSATRGRGRLAAASIGWPGMLGTLSGMNEAGLVIAVMLVYGVEDAEEGVPFTALFREALETQTTVAGVREFLESHPRTNSNNLLVVEPGGKAAILEIRPSKVTPRAMEKGCLYSTNHFLEAGAPGFLRDPVRLPSLFRYHRLRWFAEGRGHALGPEDVKRGLGLVASRWLNLQSMVFEPARRRMEVSMGVRPATKGPWREFTGEMLFG
jgi:isopenicillin-N N-acyltransferase-like protein